MSSSRYETRVQAVVRNLVKPGVGAAREREAQASAGHGPPVAGRGPRRVVAPSTEIVIAWPRVHIVARGHAGPDLHRPGEAGPGLAESAIRRRYVRGDTHPAPGAGRPASRGRCPVSLGVVVASPADPGQCAAGRSPSTVRPPARLASWNEVGWILAPAPHRKLTRPFCGQCGFLTCRSGRTVGPGGLGRVLGGGPRR
jgi:hypothetical protein